MRLTSQQIAQFEEQGFLSLPGCFSDEEVAVLRSEAENIYATERQEVWREKSGAPRTAFAAHTYNEAFRLLGAHPRLLRPVEQVFGEPLYMHQFKINAKAAFDGEVWQWHQDYGTWARDDGMPEPRAMNIAVFLDEVMAINGPDTAHSRLDTTAKRHPTRCGRWTTKPSLAFARKAGSSLRPANQARS